MLSRVRPILEKLKRLVMSIPVGLIKSDFILGNKVLEFSITAGSFSCCSCLEFHIVIDNLMEVFDS